MKTISSNCPKTIRVYCGEACISNECTSEIINLSNHQYDQVAENITTRFDRFIHTPQELPDRIIDLIHIASYVFCADRCANRGERTSLSNSSWSRKWQFTIPVLDFDFWSSCQVKTALSDALVFMTGDKSFDFQFSKASCEPLKTEAYQTSLFSNSDVNTQLGKNIDVMLFSGGLDSLAGAIDRLNTFPDRQLCLINHMSNNRTIRTQRNLTKELQRRYPDRIFPYTFECRFKNLKSRDETQRTRMFLFSAIAFAICNYYSKDELFIYENGVTSLNLSKQTDVINARSSRTTHPKVLGLLQRFYSLFSDSFRIRAPYYKMTKEDIINVFARFGESELIQSSVSCSSTRDRHDLFPHCGCCSQCIDRRFAMYAAGLQDVDFTYNLDIANDTMDSETKQRVSALLFFTENEIGDTEIEFLKKHPQELTEIIEYWPGSKEDSLNEIFDLYSRYRDSIRRATFNMEKNYCGVGKANRDSLYGRVTQRVDYEKEKQELFDEKIRQSVFILESNSDDNPRQGSGFFLYDYGLLTSHHVIEDSEFYKVCTCENYPTRLAVVGMTLNLFCCSKEEDYALFSMGNEPDHYFQLGDSGTLHLGDPVILIGYPEYCKGDSWDYLKTTIRKKSKLFEHELYEVDSIIRHGESGGIVLDKNERIIGLICAGVSSMDDAINCKHGFVPINIILEDIAKRGR